jgi:hypothetical protein
VIEVLIKKRSRHEYSVDGYDSAVWLDFPFDFSPLRNIFHIGGYCLVLGHYGGRWKRSEEENKPLVKQK